MPTIRHNPNGFPSAGSRIRATAIYKEKLCPRDRVISSYCKYMQLSVCQRRSARLISQALPLPPRFCPLPDIRFTYLLIQSNERAGPAFLEKKAQTINIDFIISRLVLTKSYFLVTMTRSSKRDNWLSPLHPWTSSRFARSSFHRSFPSRRYLVLIFALFYCISLIALRDVITLAKVKRRY